MNRFPGIFVLLSLLFITESFAENVLIDDSDALSKKQEITILDSLVVNMEDMNRTICIGNSVVLSCDDDKIFAYEWIDKETGEIISTTSSVRVAPKTTKEYTLNLYYFTGELIENGDFKNQSLPKEVSTGYKFVATTWNNQGRELWGEGTYRIGKSPRNFHPYFYDLVDHSGDLADHSGHDNMMIVNGSRNGNAVVWQTKVKVKKGEIYAFSTWSVEVGRNNPAQFHFTINGVPLGKDFQLKDYGESDAKWEQFYELWEADDDEAVISLVNLNIRPDGNDFAIDDISFASMKKETGTITVKVLPSLELGELNDQEVCENEPVSINAKAVGTGISGYEWKKDGITLGNVSSLLDLPAAQLGDAGKYSCSVTGECGTRTEEFRIDVREQLKIEKLRDTVRPCDRTSVSFSAGAQGYDVKYQWSGPGRGWTGKNEAIYANKEIHWDRDTGVYTCQVNSQCGDTLVYRVLEPDAKIKIIEHSDDMEVCEGSDALFYARTEPDAISITWSLLHSGKWHSGSDWVLKLATAADAGIYRCVAMDKCSVVDYIYVDLKIIPEMTFLEVAKDTAVCENGAAVFKANSDGVNVKYHWTGPDHFIADGAEIQISPVTLARCGDYYVTATDSCGRQKTGKVSLSLRKEYEDLKITPDLLICSGDSTEMSVSGGKDGMTYDWTTPNGQHYTGKSLKMNPAQEGEYVCRVVGVCPAVEKRTTVVYRPEAVMKIEKDFFRVCPGDAVVFKAMVTGDDASYVWKKDGKTVGEGSTYTLSDVKTAHAGRYDCEVHTLCKDTVLHAVLEVREPVKIGFHTTEEYVNPGEKAIIYVKVEGDSDWTFEWLREGVPVTGGTENRLDFVAPDKDTVLTYTFKVTGCNSDEVDVPVYVRSYNDLYRDSTVTLCKGSDYSVRAFERPDDWCPDGNVKGCWVLNGIDTISYLNAFFINGFAEKWVGEYVYKQESDCAGKEELHLHILFMDKPEFKRIYSDNAEEQEGVITVCEGEDIRLMTEVEAQGTLSYEWMKDGNLLSGETGPWLVLKQATPEVAGKYSCRVISPLCGDSTRDIQVKVYQKLRIDYVPVVEKCPGEAVIMRVAAMASLPSQFTWNGPSKEGWAAESDGYSAIYKSSAVGAEADGMYSCRVTNQCGDEEAVIQLKIEKDIILPDIVRDDTLCPGALAELSVPLGQEGIRYLWTLPDGSNSEQKTIVVKDFSSSKAGVYHFVLRTKNGCFQKEGDIVLHVRPELPAPRVCNDTAVCEGSSVLLSAFSQGKEVKYEWWGPAGFTARGEEIRIDPVTGENIGIYEVMVTDICNQTGKRGRVNLGLLDEFKDISMEPEAVVCEGDNLTIKLLGATENMTCEWFREGKFLGSAGPELTINKATLETAGDYVCRITGTCGYIERVVTVKVNPHIRAWKQEVEPICERDSTALVAQAEGEVTYLWTKDGAEVGDRSNRLELDDVIPSEAGIYICEVGSACGDTTLMYDFRLKENTRILNHSRDRVLCEDDDYKLMVEAEGVNNQYTWTCDGVELPEHTDFLDRPAVGHPDTLFYTCRVAGECGADSISLYIYIGEYKKIREDYSDTVCEGSNYKYNVDVVPLGAFEGQGFNYCWVFKGDTLYSGLSSIFPLMEVTPDREGDYFCTISTLPDAPEFRSAELKVHIEVVSLPRIISMTPDIFAVEGSCDTLRVEALGEELSYSWTKDGVATANKDSVWYFIPISEEHRGRYQVKVANRCGPVYGSTQVEVWEKTVIVYPQESRDSVCLGSDKDLNVEAWGKNLVYKWYKDGEQLNTAMTQPLHLEQVEAQDSGLYVCVVSGRGGTDSCRIHFKVLSLPDIDIDGDSLLCRNEASMTQEYQAISTETKIDYRWSTIGGDILEGKNREKMTVKWDMNGEASLTLSITSLISQCSNTMTKDIDFNSLPDVNMVVPDRVGYCRDTLALDRAYPWGGIFYVNGEVSDKIHFTDKTIAYHLEYVYMDESTGCSATAYDTVRVAAAPVLKMAKDTITTGWCAPVVIEIKEHSEEQVVWYGEPQLEILDLLHARYQASGYSDRPLSFWAAVTDEYNCLAADTTVVVLLPSPKVNLEPDTVVGLCNDIVLRAAYEDLNVQSAEWRPADKLQVLDRHHAEVVKKEEGVNEFVLIVTDANGCIGGDTANVTFMPMPELESKEVCVGTSVPVDVTAFPDYQWKDGWNEPRRTLTEPGIYRLWVKDSYGCEGEAIYQIHTLPKVVLADTMIFETQEMTFAVDENGEYAPYDFKWQDGSISSSYTTGTEGYYSVIVSDNIGCTSGDTAFLEVRKKYIAAPDAFLPESGGENSRFYLKEVNFVNGNFEMYIYDRWGELLFTTRKIGFDGGWDGTFKGIKCLPGAYVWVAYVDGKEVGKGTLMLVK